VRSSAPSALRPSRAEPGGKARPVGLEAIIDYKLVKALVEAIAGILLVVGALRGPEALFATVAQFILDHAAGAWALRAATLLVLTGTAGHVKIAAAVAIGDSALSAVEGLALRAGRWWAPWLVVFATGALIPVEIWELLRKPRPIRGAILGINLAILVYLLRVALRHHREHVAALRASGS
jgi:uncharacterized membrane protein (DUF2068 family)